MNAARSSVRWVVLALTLVIALSMAAPALGAGRGPVPNDPVIRGVHLGGLSEGQAYTAISRVMTTPVLAPLKVVAGGKAFIYRPGGAVVADVSAMLNEAYASHATTTFELTPRYRSRNYFIWLWVAKMAGRVDKAPVDAVRTIRNGRLYVIAQRPGFKVNRAGTVRLIAARLLREAATHRVDTRPLAVPYSRPQARLTVQNMGKTIVVSLSQRRVRLYRGWAAEKVFACAIGQPEYPTPRGLFKVINKVKLPAWRNPGSSWADSMPAYIAPGPSNPLGTRALYLNSPGIRIHGTVKISSIGTAASHGCIRLANRNIEELYPLVPIGTPVYIVK